MTTIQFQRLVFEDHLQLGHLLKIVQSLEIFYQQTIKLIVSCQEVYQQQFILELEGRVDGMLLPGTVLLDNFLPEAFDFGDGGPQSEDAVVLGESEVVVQNLSKASVGLVPQVEFFKQFKVS